MSDSNSDDDARDTRKQARRKREISPLFDSDSEAGDSGKPKESPTKQDKFEALLRLAPGDASASDQDKDNATKRRVNAGGDAGDDAEQDSSPKAQGKSKKDSQPKSRSNGAEKRHDDDKREASADEADGERSPPKEGDADDDETAKASPRRAGVSKASRRSRSRSVESMPESLMHTTKRERASASQPTQASPFGDSEEEAAPRNTENSSVKKGEKRTRRPSPAPSDASDDEDAPPSKRAATGRGRRSTNPSADAEKPRAKSASPGRTQPAPTPDDDNDEGASKPRKRGRPPGSKHGAKKESVSGQDKLKGDLDTPRSRPNTRTKEAVDEEPEEDDGPAASTANNDEDAPAPRRGRGQTKRNAEATSEKTGKKRNTRADGEADPEMNGDESEEPSQADASEGDTPERRRSSRTTAKGGRLTPENSEDETFAPRVMLNSRRNRKSRRIPQMKAPQNRKGAPRGRGRRAARDDSSDDEQGLAGHLFSGGGSMHSTIKQLVVAVARNTAMLGDVTAELFRLREAIQENHP